MYSQSMANCAGSHFMTAFVRYGYIQNLLLFFFNTRPTLYLCDILIKKSRNPTFHGMFNFETFSLNMKKKTI